MCFNNINATLSVVDCVFLAKRIFYPIPHGKNNVESFVDICVWEYIFWRTNTLICVHSFKRRYILYINTWTVVLRRQGSSMPTNMPTLLFYNVVFSLAIYIVYNGFCIATKKRKVSLWSKTNKPLETMKAKLLFGKMLCMAHMYFPCQLAKIPPPSFTAQRC